MPARNRIKQYASDSYYHLYNRGHGKKPIFLDNQDYRIFLSYLEEYLLPKNEKLLMEDLNDPTLSPAERDKVLQKIRRNNFADEITFLAYCLMPNHFHFFVKQKSAESIDSFMNSLGTRYSMYFNKKYKQVGSLYQGVYKAVLITHEAQFLHLSRYIHKQALPHQPSSYRVFIGKEKIPWIQTSKILSYFSKTNPSLSYKSFVAEQDDLEIIYHLMIEEQE